eukprot:TRINITY_DN30307_c0_g1_i1.p1 TRINITY_DN30307_c0_g1~~TRINITY_DN30307_c0_g1_i1.p1  ORF type:complete len:306 (-),score=34.26 TRINITY_DN30307_c0_g1_i1:358-1275(-)
MLQGCESEVGFASYCCPGAYGCLFCVVATGSAISSFVSGIAVKVVEEEIADMKTAWDTSCSLSSQPGVVAVTKEDLKYNCGSKNNCKKLPSQIIECRVSLIYRSQGFHDGGSGEAFVHAGRTCNMTRTDEDLQEVCDLELSRTSGWHNLQIKRSFNSNQMGVLGSLPMDIPPRIIWSCGDVGKTEIVPVGDAATCTHRFGNGVDFPCTIELEPGKADFACYVLGTGEVNVGTTSEEVSRLTDEMASTESARITAMVVSIVFVFLCVFFSIASCTCFLHKDRFVRRVLATEKNDISVFMGRPVSMQ